MPKASRLAPGSAVRWVRAHESLTLLLFLWLVGIGFMIPRMAIPELWNTDYLNYWFAPRALRAGVNIYDLAAYQHYGLSFFPQAHPPQLNFTYPPHSLFLFWPLSYLPAYASYATWDVVSLAAFYLAARPVVPKGLPAFIGVLSSATILCLQFGQTSLLSGALFLLAARGNGYAGAMLTFKPQLGFLAAPLLLLKGRKPVVVAIVATTLLIIASQLLFGHWADFLDHAGGYQAAQIFDEEKKNIWYIIGTTPAMGYGLKGFLIYLFVGTLVLSRNFNIWTAATATFLISPYGFHYDMSVACLGFAILIYSYWERMPLWQRLTASLAFLAPVIVQFGTWWVPPIMLLGLFVQTECFPGVRLTWRGGRLAVVPIKQPEPSPG